MANNLLDSGILSLLGLVGVWLGSGSGVGLVMSFSAALTVNEDPQLHKSSFIHPQRE